MSLRWRLPVQRMPAATARSYDFCELPLWWNKLQYFDKNVHPDLTNAPELLAGVPLSVWAETLLDPPRYFPRAHEFLPSMPADEIQTQWTGKSGRPLLAQSAAFMAILLRASSELDRPLSDLQVLDFGAGWGRLTRLWLKYLPPQQVECADAWAQSIEVFREGGLQNRIKRSHDTLQKLPYGEGRFDLIYAFSVFTHLNPEAFNACLGGLRRMVKERGMVTFTVRPSSYWHASGKAALVDEAEAAGCYFVPHRGRKWFGDTSVNEQWLQEALTAQGLVMVDQEWSVTDPHQVTVIATRVG